VAIPQYDGTNPDHTEIAGLSRACHVEIGNNDSELSRLEAQLDLACGRVFGFDKTDAARLRECLAQIRQREAAIVGKRHKRDGD
jgi:hypothetical protein